ncbi:hypothetical protein EHS13_17765 [Paenibacillus psychroresistens]|uniref:Uncharacterized protein n=1 Tax=Paenibacillus psychroresistens TaxID=1778678 RepID=A0A6B8RKM5_9BACL|nr:hypothetical protein [Paenibacillus psychroresistens]QGQ96589.1 hypothetical protein EHS13_17765 [Paenibacillus psychroresistens]
MGYYFRGMISTDNIVNISRDKYKNLNIINLYNNLVIIPLTDELFDEVNENRSVSIKNYKYFTDRIGLFCSNISMISKIAYVEAEYFGGIGSQNGIVWDKEKVFFEETLSDNAINKALEILGIKKSKDKDEFDTVGFGRHRNVDDWITVNNRYSTNGHDSVGVCSAAAPLFY